LFPAQRSSAAPRCRSWRPSSSSSEMRKPRSRPRETRLSLKAQTMQIVHPYRARSATERRRTNPSPAPNPFADADRQALWRRTLQLCGGDASRADVVLTAQLSANSPSLAPLSRSKDWGVRHPGPDPQLIQWLRESRAEWVAGLSRSHHEPCEQCGQPVGLSRGRRRRVWCSELCARAWYNANRPKVRRDAKACPECGNAFEPTRSDALYCSRACQQGAYRRRVALSDIPHNAPETAAIEMVPAVCSELALYRNSALSHHRQSPLGRAV
jgi:ribosomal protein S27AE